MGSFLNPGTIEFEEALNSEIYIDKSGLIEITNAVLRTQQKFMCISRPRRFGKSMAANMLSAYYDRSVNSEHLFRHLRIHGIPSFQEHLNQYVSGVQYQKVRQSDELPAQPGGGR